ncbi:hypothetical protein [Streptomyces sp. NPDC005573]|uniref:hypothetical protein n=1 Tax=unclassified Streptomyces TaxID=2593676 RepID=UPI0033B58189
MADEHDKWLNRETAERLLSGESLEAVAPAARDRAGRLAALLGTLAAEAAPSDGELPGEEGAVAAFRKAREAADAERAAAALGSAATDRPAVSAPGFDAGLVRIDPLAHDRRTHPPRTGGTRARGRDGLRAGAPARRPRWGRPVRLVLAAAVAVGTVGGVAMAAGGVLPSPFHHHRPDPGASVSATATPGQTLASPSPRPSRTGGPQAAPSGSAGGSTGGGPAATGRPDAEAGSAHASGTSSGAPRPWWRTAVLTCRDLREGREPGAERRRVLEGLAGGPARVKTYCGTVLSSGGDGNRGDGKGDGRRDGRTGGREGGGGRDGRGDRDGKGDDDEGHGGRDRGHRRHHGHRRGGLASAFPTPLAPARPWVKNVPAPPASAPSPSFHVL